MCVQGDVIKAEDKSKKYLDKAEILHEGEMESSQVRARKLPMHVYISPTYSSKVPDNECVRTSGSCFCQPAGTKMEPSYKQGLKEKTLNNCTNSPKIFMHVPNSWTSIISVTMHTPALDGGVQGGLV